MKNYDISIVIPAYNSERTIKNLLECIEHQKFTGTYEIIVVDNSSNDSTVKTIKTFMQKSKVKTTTLVVPRGVTISHVRNCGAWKAKGRVLAFIDSDCKPSEDWLKRGFQFLNTCNEPTLLAGGCHPPADATWVQKAWYSTRAGHGRCESFFVHGANFFISKKLFDVLGGFDENLITSEDYDLGRRACLVGKVVYDHDISVIHYGDPENLYKKMMKERWYGKKKIQKFSDLIRSKVNLVSFMFLVNILFLFISMVLLKFKISTFFIFSIAIMTVGLSFFLCHRAKNYKYFIQLIPISLVYLGGRALGLIDSVFCGYKKK